MINALQVLATVLMSNDEIDEKTIDDHMKLFMSTAHFLHESYGYLGMTETEVDSEYRKATKKSVYSGLSMNDCAAILEEFETEPEDGLKRRRKQVQAIKVAELRGKWAEKEIEGHRSLNKQELVSALLEKISIKHQSGTDDDADHNKCNHQPKVESKCWMKGNWLSFTANIAKQIAYLGPLPLLW